MTEFAEFDPPLAVPHLGLLDDLIEASNQARAAAAATLARSGAIAERVGHSRREALARRLASRAHLTFAKLEALVNGHRDHAVVRTDGTVAAGLEWLRRARLVVGLGETFDDGRLQASLDGVPVVITLTLMRACDEIVAVELCGRSLWARS